MSTKKHGHVFSFSNLSFSVDNNNKGCCGNKEKKTLIHGISGMVCSGQMVAIMGPSGAGKTTLLNVLSLRDSYGNTTGEIFLDGVDFDIEIFKRKCYFVGQFDMNWPYLTVRETLTYALRLFHLTTTTLTDKDASNIVSKLINEVGLTDVSKNRNSSLSGGQKRRLSLAIAMLKQPKLLFLDEITSGLDSASADMACQAIRRLTDNKNISVICTIHQPSTKIFLEYFDKLILLSKGKVAYFGSTKEAHVHFSNLGYPVPAMTNPSEYFLELVNSNYGNESTVDLIIDSWHETAMVTDSINVEEQVQKQDQEEMSFFDPKLWILTFFTETQIVLKRHFKMMYRDHILYVGRFTIAFFLNILFGIVYWHSRKNTQDQVISKAWIVVWYLSCPVMLGAVAVYVTSDEISAVKQEQRNGMLRYGTYATTKVILSVPIIFLFAIVCLGIPGWVLQGYEMSPFVEVIILWSVTAYTFENLAECLAIWISDKIIGMLLYLGYWISAFLFSGLFLPFNDLPLPCKGLYYVMPFSYYFRSCFYVLFRVYTFQPCDRKLNPMDPICVDSSAGQDVISGLHNFLPLFENNDTYKNDIWLLLGMAFVFKLFYLLGLVCQI